MKENSNAKRVCSFYVSNMHFATMILPWANKQLEEKTKIITFFENNFTTNIELVLSKLIITEERKKELLNINWKNTNAIKYLNVEKNLKNMIMKNEKNVIIINGTEEYIEYTNDFIKKYIDKNSKRLELTGIKVINFYEVGNFNENIKDILDKHDMIFNTSGEYKIEDVFEGYQKKEKINI